MAHPRRLGSKRERTGFACRLVLYSLLIQLIVALVLWLTVVFKPDKPSPPLTAHRVIDEPPNEPRNLPSPSKASVPSSPALQLAMETARESIRPELLPLASPFRLSPVAESLSWDPLVGSPSGMGWGGAEGTGSGFGSGRGERSLGGLRMKARRLGLILDVSMSMNADLPHLRRELARRFPTSPTVNVNNCELKWTREDQGFALERWMQPSTHAPGHRDPRNNSVLAAVQHLVFTYDVDAIYWFSDFRDSRSEAGLERLATLLGTDAQHPRHAKVRLYLRSVGLKPDAKLQSIVTESGGQWR